MIVFSTFIAKIVLFLKINKKTSNKNKCKFYELMRKKLSGFRVENGNFIGNEYLLENARGIRPDFLIYEENTDKTPIILDAKYKNYDTIGTKANEKGVISREDLYQLATYILHYKSNLGVILSPTFNKQKAEIKQFVSDENKALAICGLDFKANENLNSKKTIKEKDIKEIHNKEQIFIEALRNLIQIHFQKQQDSKKAI